MMKVLIMPHKLMITYKKEGIEGGKERRRYVHGMKTGLGPKLANVGVQHACATHNRTGKNGDNTQSDNSQRNNTSRGKSHANCFSVRQISLCFSRIIRLIND